MNHIECAFALNPFTPFNEILVASLSDFPFESFVEEDGKVLAYISKENFNLEEIKSLYLFGLEELSIDFSFKEIEKVNWNQKWEESFDAVEVDDFCYIRAPFHSKKENFQHEIVIEPKMSFGTGHHQTTQLMLKLMAKMKLENQQVLDMGSGTGVLAIMAEKLGAKTVDAIDIEEWAFLNMKENFERNNCTISNGFFGGAELLENKPPSYDVVFANINKNILVRDIPIYLNASTDKVSIVLSGFFVTDKDEMEKYMHNLDFQITHYEELEDWCAICFDKK